MRFLVISLPNNLMRQNTNPLFKFLGAAVSDIYRGEQDLREHYVNLTFKST